MKYDDLMILEGMFIDVTREDVKDVIRAKLAATKTIFLPFFLKLLRPLVKISILFFSIFPPLFMLILYYVLGKLQIRLPPFYLFFEDIIFL